MASSHRLMATLQSIVGAGLVASLVTGAPPALALPQAAAERAQEPPLRVSVPLTAVVADLESYIPQRMREAGVPGLSIALIRDFEVAWSAGFGVKNVLTGDTVTDRTVFEVASISKVVTAYAALRLVERGELSLDAPIVGCLSYPWLTPSEYGDRITLRQLASHSSGLTDQLLPVDKHVTFEPGTDFLYSGVGAMYMQEAIEQVTGSSLRQAGLELVFEPLDMSSSSFVNGATILRRMANGHMSYAFPLLALLSTFVPIFVVLALLNLPARRIFAGTWRTSKAWVGASTLVAATVTLVILYLTVGRALPSVAVLVVLVGVGFAVAMIGLTLLGRYLMSRGAGTRERRRAHPALTAAWVAVCAAGLALLFASIHGPVPRSPSPRPSAVGSLRSTAPDLATFLIELARPRLLNQELAEQIRTPQTSIDGHFSWGLGPGIQHSRQGDALWQNGMTFGYRSVMVIYPDRGIGAVVLTNSERGFPLAYDIVARAIGGKDQLRYF